MAMRLPGKNPGPRESEVLAACLRWLQMRGVVCWRNNNAGVRRRDRSGKEFWTFNGTPGVSDILCCLPGGTLCAIEAKRPGGKATEAQLAFQDAIRREGGCAFTCHSLDELIEQMEEILHGH